MPSGVYVSLAGGHLRRQISTFLAFFLLPRTQQFSRDAEGELYFSQQLYLQFMKDIMVATLVSLAIWQIREIPADY